MDVSQEYVKMCDEAEEIQRRHHPNPYIDGWFPNGIIVPRIGRGGDAVWALTCEGYVWLPRQDQLQGMVKTTSIEDLMLDFISFTSRHLDNPFTDYARKFTSMEQLWLAYVMRRKFDKVWSGNRWVLTKAEAEIL